MKSYHHYHFNFHKYMKVDLSKLELSVWLHSTGRSLIATFIPIIMLVAGFSLTSVLIIWFLFCIIDTPLNLLARKAVLKIGAKNTIIIGILAEIAYFIILYFATLDWYVSVALALAAAVYDSFYWTAHWYVFNECVEPSKGIARQIGFLEIFRQAGALIAPLIGALFLIFLSKEYLIIASLAFLIISLIPLTRIRLDHLKPKASLPVKEFFSDIDNRKTFLLVSLYAIHSEVLETIVPISIYVIFNGLGYVGIFPMAVSIASIIFLYFAGMMIDKDDKQKIIMISALVLAAIWVSTLFVKSLTIIYSIAILMGFFGYMMAMALDANTIIAAKKTDMLDASTFRNAVHMGSRALLYLILIFAIEVFHTAFLAAALGMMLIVLAIPILYGYPFKDAAKSANAKNTSMDVKS